MHRIRSLFARIVDHILGPVARGAMIVADREAMLVLNPRIAT